MNIEIVECDKENYERIDDFLLSKETNGEFINTHKYLSYHPEGKFEDVSVALIDKGSNQIIFSFIAIVNKEKKVISHSGTSFGGPFFNTKKIDALKLDEYMGLVELYYKSKGFNKIDVRLPAVFFHEKTSDLIQWVLWKRNYEIAGMNLGNYIYMNDFKSVDDIQKNYESKRRNQVKKVITGDNFFLDKTEKIPLDGWNTLTNNLKIKYNTTPTHSYKEISILKEMFPENIISYVVRSKEEKDYSALGIVYLYKQVYHTQYLDMNYKYSNQYPNLFLIHNLLVDCLKSDMRYFSFGPSTEKWGEFLNKGLYKYKNKFGSSSVIYTRYQKTLNGGIE